MSVFDEMAATLGPTPPPETFNRAALVGELTEDEGRRLDLYVDSRGNPSTGVGHNLRNGISNAVCDLLLNEDVNSVVATLDREAPWWRRLPASQARVLLNLCFNMGWGKLSQFVRFLAAMQAGEWGTAADELKDSAWWGEVGERGPRMVARLTGTGEG